MTTDPTYAARCEQTAARVQPHGVVCRQCAILVVTIQGLRKCAMVEADGGSKAWADCVSLIDRILAEHTITQQENS